MKGRKGKKYAEGGEVSPFGKAFREARAAKAKEFTFGGKKYHTRTKEEDAKASPVKVPETPKPPATSHAPGAATKPSSGPDKSNYKGRTTEEIAALGKKRREAFAAGVRKVGAALTPKDSPPKPASMSSTGGRAAAVGRAAAEKRKAATGYKKGGSIKKRKRYI